MKSQLWQFLQDGDHEFSATRLGFLVTLFTVLGVWVYSCIKENKFMPMDNSAIYLIGVLMIGKTTQSFSENQTIDGTKTKIGGS